MSELDQFSTFAELMKHCFKLQKEGNAQAAEGLLLTYIQEARRRRKEESMWGDYFLQQALGLRSSFTEADVQPQLDHIEYCEGEYRYFVNSLAESHARLAISFFETGDGEQGHTHAKASARFAGLVENVSRTVADAAERDEQYRLSQLKRGSSDEGEA